MSAAGVATLSPLEDQIALVPQCLFGAQPLDSILIFLAVPGTPLVPMHVLDSESVASVKLRIQQFKGFVATKQRLVFGGHELTHNRSRVRDYGLADGNVLHLVIRLVDLRAITIETADRKKFKFQVESGRKVGYLKNKIAAETGEQIENFKDQRFVLGDEELEDHQLITDIVKKDDVVIHMFVRDPAKVQTQQIDKETVVTVVTPKDVGNIHIDALNYTELASHGCAPVEPIIINRKVKLFPAIMEMIGATIAGLENGYVPVMSAEGSGGVYFMKDQSGESNIAVFKPIDEEPMAENNPRGLPLSVDGEGLKRGTRVGEGALREVAAYLLDHPIDGCRSDDGTGFSGVPPTALVRSFHMGKELRIGSLQMFVENQGSCEDVGPRAFPVKEVQKIAVLDIRLANADRHSGNILVCQDGDHKMQLVPIDHGYCFPEKFEDCTFEWLYWPQAREPFSTETLAYIESLDAGKDIALLKFHGWELSSQCARVLHVSTMLLKKGAERGLTPYGIGSIMCRETVNKESRIETLIVEAEYFVVPETSEETFLETVSEIMDRRLDSML
ncbi:Phosphatidylinositol 4-kinase gamma 3 [Dichanthelium oligosanthes]|uniref:1-phosphatidylinositol 4-kinase n=1 Tax=Dichanthelium oligosanthes TaxID=888268 RepID=A0A1E5US88_9POAL|nr:Phosphatidylinositol 4-kinase gamma 3 [Dichanthelium oligosanthes]